MNRPRDFIATMACALVLIQACTALAPTEAPLAAVALVEVPEPARLSVIVQKHPDAFASQVRGLFFAAEMGTKAHALADALKPHPFAPGAMLTEAFVEALRRPGHLVVRAPDPRRERDDFLKDYAVLGAKATVYLDIIPRAIGYWAESPAGPYRPWVIVNYRVYDSREGKVLASGLIGAGPSPAGDTSIEVAQDGQFAFESFAALTGDPVRAIAGLRAAIRQVAQALAQKF